MELIPAGYFPKLAEPRPAGWRSNLAVEEICSVSTCISRGPEGWIEHWRHNRAGFYRSEAEAWSIVPARSAAFDIYAYKLFPASFDETHGEIAFNDDERSVLGDLTGIAPLPEDYRRLGYDVVGQSLAWTSTVGFGCSPLTCNGLAAEIVVNRYALIDDLAPAIAAAVRIAREQPEPGRYYVVEVWRKARPAERTNAGPAAP